MRENFAFERCPLATQSRQKYFFSIKIAYGIPRTETRSMWKWDTGPKRIDSGIVTLQCELYTLYCTVELYGSNRTVYGVRCTVRTVLCTVRTIGYNLDKNGTGEQQSKHIASYTILDRQQYIQRSDQVPHTPDSIHFNSLSSWGLHDLFLWQFMFIETLGHKALCVLDFFFRKIEITNENKSKNWFQNIP